MLFKHPVHAWLCTFTTILLCTDARVYICDFHREQCWERWTSLSKHGVTGVKEEVLARLRHVARASTVQAFTEAVDSLKTSQVWKENKSLQQWFDTTWLPEHKVCI